VRAGRQRFAWTVLLTALPIGACGGRGCGAPGRELGQADAHPGAEDAAAPEDGSLGAVNAEDGASVEDRDAGENAEIDAARGAPEAGARLRCPKEMVNVAGRFCIDRYEDSLVDDATGEHLSPHYPPEPGLALRMFTRWEEERLTVGSPSAREMPLPCRCGA
jgi:hypothetical protein